MKLYVITYKNPFDFYQNKEIVKIVSSEDVAKNFCWIEKGQGYDYDEYITDGNDLFQEFYNEFANIVEDGSLTQDDVCYKMHDLHDKWGKIFLTDNKENENV